MSISRLAMEIEKEELRDVAKAAGLEYFGMLDYPDDDGWCGLYKSAGQTPAGMVRLTDLAANQFPDNFPYITTCPERDVGHIDMYSLKHLADKWGIACQ